MHTEPRVVMHDRCQPLAFTAPHNGAEVWVYRYLGHTGRGGRPRYSVLRLIWDHSAGTCAFNFNMDWYSHV